MAAARFVLALIGLAIPPLAIANGTPESCFVKQQRFEPTEANIPRIICPFLSSLINEKVLPIKKFYARAELAGVTMAAGLKESTAVGHTAANFQFFAAGLIDIFNMEGNPNEHATSSGIHDCETKYPCFDGNVYLGEAKDGVCDHLPVIQGRQAPFPLPIPKLTPALKLFCPDIVDHMPKCLWTSTCNCTIPNDAKLADTWNAVDINKDGLVTRAEFKELLIRPDTALLAPLSQMHSVDLNPIGSDALSPAWLLFIDIFANQKVGISPALSKAQFVSLNKARKFPLGYTFPKVASACFIDPNEAVNQNDYSSVAAMSNAWSLAKAEPFPKGLERCRDQTNGLSQLTGDIFFGKGSITTIVNGQGVGYVDFGNCGSEGSVSIRVDGVPIKFATSSVSLLATFAYTDGQKVSLDAAYGGVIRLNFAAFNGTTACSDGPCAPQTQQTGDGPCASVAQAPGSYGYAYPANKARLHASEDLDAKKDAFSAFKDSCATPLGMFALFAIGAVVAMVGVSRTRRSTTSATELERRTYKEVCLEGQAGEVASDLLAD